MRNRVLIAIILAAALVSIAVLTERFIVEQADRTYDIVLDYTEFAAMAEQSEADLSYWLSAFKSMGISKVGLSEESLSSLCADAAGTVSVKMMDAVISDADWRGAYPAEWVERMESFGFDRYDVMAEFTETETFDFVKNAWEARFLGIDATVGAFDAKSYILIDGNASNALYSEKYKVRRSDDGMEEHFAEKIDIVASKLMYLSLGFSPEKIAEIREAGLSVVPRTANYAGMNDRSYAEAAVSGYEAFGIRPDYLIFAGDSILGNDDGIAFLVDYANENDVILGLIENTTQLGNIEQSGINDAVVATQYRAVRVFSVWNYIQNRYQSLGYSDSEEIVNALFHAVLERNNRVVYLKPMKESGDERIYVTDVAAYRKMLQNLQTRLEKYGFSMGEASIMRAVRVPVAAKIALAFGAMAAGLLMWNALFTVPAKALLFSAIAGGACICAIGLGYPGMSEIVFSFGSAVVYACLTIFLLLTLCNRVETRFRRGIATPRRLYEAVVPGPKGRELGGVQIIAFACLALPAVVLASVLGGALTAAPISSVGYMLELTYYRGVKLAQLLPLCFFAAIFPFAYGNGGGGKFRTNEWKAGLTAIVRMWMLPAAVVVLGIGLYYILRTGQTILPVSNIEIQFRNKLEELFWARPRNKEFLFAFPAIMLAICAAARRLKRFVFVFGLCGAVGITSVINTFLHIRAPLHLGLARTGYSLLFGMIIGIVAVFVFDIAYRKFSGYRLPAPRRGFGREEPRRLDLGRSHNEDV
jgi:hypothetical protein